MVCCLEILRADDPIAVDVPRTARARARAQVGDQRQQIRHAHAPVAVEVRRCSVAGPEAREQQEQVNDVHFAVAGDASAREEGSDFLQDLVAARRAHKKNPHK